MLPSPRGDELFLTRFLFPWMMQTSYRPLAGMNCFELGQATERQDEMLPSPRGDELFQAVSRDMP